MTTKTTDEKTMALIAEVKKQKAEIAKIEKPNYLTNCSFSYDENTKNNALNLHVQSDVKILICIVAFLREKSKAYDAAVKELGVDNAPTFTWCSFPVEDWVQDIKMKIGKIQVGAKKKKLEALETRLSAIISPELKAQLELDAIMEELK